MHDLRVQVTTWLRPQHIMQNERHNAEDFVQCESVHEGLKWAKPNDIVFKDIYLFFMESKGLIND